MTRRGGSRDYLVLFDVERPAEALFCVRRSKLAAPHPSLKGAAEQARSQGRMVDVRAVCEEEASQMLKASQMLRQAGTPATTPDACASHAAHLTVPVHSPLSTQSVEPVELPSCGAI